MKTLKQAVKEIILEEIKGMDKEEIEYYFDNPSEYTCKNGCVSSLIYYNDTEAFAKEYYEDIIELMNDYEIYKLTLNDMAWFAYETLVPTLKNEILVELFPNVKD